jgi:hypothetical protein
VGGCDLAGNLLFAPLLNLSMYSVVQSAMLLTVTLKLLRLPYLPALQWLASLKVVTNCLPKLLTTIDPW